MPTYVTKTIRPGGTAGANCDYTSLENFDAGYAKDLTTADEVVTAYCIGGATADNTKFNIQATWVTDDTRYIKVFVDPAARHNGVYSTSKWRLATSGGDWNMAVLGITIPVKIEFYGMQFYAEGNNSSVVENLDPTGSGNQQVLFKDCIFYHGGTGVTSTQARIIYGLVWRAAGTQRWAFVNCIFRLSNTGTAIRMIACNYNPTYGKLYLYNCNFIWGSAGGTIATDGPFKGSTCFGRNLLLVGGDYSNGDVTSGNHSYVASDGTITYGTNISNKRESQNFAFKDKAAGDYHLLGTDPGARDYGTDLSGNPDSCPWTFKDDIDRWPRGATWDIGAFEYLTPLGPGVHGRLPHMSLRSDGYAPPLPILSMEIKPEWRDRAVSFVVWSPEDRCYIDLVQRTRAAYSATNRHSWINNQFGAFKSDTSEQGNILFSDHFAWSRFGPASRIGKCGITILTAFRERPSPSGSSTLYLYHFPTGASASDRRSTLSWIAASPADLTFEVAGSGNFSMTKASGNWSDKLWHTVVASEDNPGSYTTNSQKVRVYVDDEPYVEDTADQWGDPTLGRGTLALCNSSLGAYTSNGRFYLPYHIVLVNTYAGKVQHDTEPCFNQMLAGDIFNLFCRPIVRDRALTPSASTSILPLVSMGMGNCQELCGMRG